MWHIKLSDSIVPIEKSEIQEQKSNQMYKIKYGKSRPGGILFILCFVLFFAAGAITVICAEKLWFIKAAGSGETAPGVDAIPENEASCILREAPEAAVREVCINGIEISNFISEGDIIDVRTVNSDGRDEKLLAEKCITGLERSGVFLIVREDELEIITDALIKMEDGRIVRAYAVRIP